MNLFSPPSLDDLIRLLRAWKFWVLAAIIGAVIGAAVYYVARPPFRARATVVVDFNLEQAWPQETDRQQFYYLERETRKLEELALSDEVMKKISSESGFGIEDLRGGKLELSQPAEGGWHFYATDKDAAAAQQLASAWANAFAERAKVQIRTSDGLNSFIEVTVTQSESLPVWPNVSLSSYLFIGAVGFASLAALFFLFFSKPK